MTATEATVRTLFVEPGSELARALDDAQGQAIVLVKDGVRFRVTPEDIWSDYDPEGVREALRRSAGALSPEVAQALNAEIRRERGDAEDPTGL